MIASARPHDSGGGGRPTPADPLPGAEPGAAHDAAPPIIDPQPRLGGGRNGGDAPPDFDAFISYAHSDGKDVAATLEAGLRRRGLRVWRDETSLSVGDSLLDKIRDGLDRSSHMVAVVTPDYLERPPALMELGTALLGRPDRRIFPVLHKTGPGEVLDRLPLLADTVMASWGDDPERLMDGIARAAGGAGAGQSKGAPAEPINARSGVSPSAVHSKMRRYSKGVLLSIPSHIGGQVIPRPQAGEIASLLRRFDRIVLTGDKGSGKSVILCQLYEILEAEGRRAVLVRCDDFLGPDSGGLDGMLGSGIRIMDFLESVRDGSETVFLFDSLDAVGRDDRSMESFRKFIRHIWATGGAKTICSVRAYDHEHSPSISRDRWGHEVRVKGLGDGDIDGALGRAGIRAVPGGLRRILRSPLCLKLLCDMAERHHDADFSGIVSEARLYAEHWREFVDRGDPRGDVARTLLDAAWEMVETRSTAIPADSFKDRSGGLDASFRNGILLESHGLVRFFHHAYLDYAASRRILRDHSDLAGFLGRDEYNVFLRPTMSFALSMLRDRGASGYLRAVVSICRSNLKHYWKITALESLAAADGFSGEEAGAVGHMLAADPSLRRHFLDGAARAGNPFWFRLWSGTVIEEWAAGGSDAGRIVDYLISLSDHREHHAEMLRLARLLVSSGGASPEERKRAVAATARLSAPDRAAWYEDLSLGGDALIRSGVLSCLWDLLDEDPDAAASVFRNIATHGRGPSRAAHLPERDRDDQSTLLRANDMYERLFLKDPAAMARAAVESVGILKGDGGPPRGPGPIAEDPVDLWSGGQTPSIHTTMLHFVGKAIPGLLDADAPACAALFSSSRLAVFHKMLLQTLLGDPHRFRDLIYCEISDPRVLALPSMRGYVQAAIRAISPDLSGRQRDTLLGRIIDLDSMREDPTGGLKSHYLSTFDRSALSQVHLDFLARFPPPEPEPDEPDEPEPDEPEPDEPEPDEPEPDEPDEPEPNEPDEPEPDPDEPEPDEPEPDPDEPEPDEPEPEPDDPDEPEPDPDEPDDPDDPDDPEPDPDDPEPDPDDPEPDPDDPDEPDPDDPDEPDPDDPDEPDPDEPDEPDPDEPDEPDPDEPDEPDPDEPEPDPDEPEPDPDEPEPDPDEPEPDPDEPPDDPNRADPLGDAIDRFSQPCPGHRDEYDILATIAVLLRDDKTPLGGAASERARNLFLRMAAHPDPRKDPPVGSGFASVPRDNMRGLAAMGLIRLYARTRDASLPAAIEGLSADGIGRVRAGVACELELLFGADPALASRITTRYSSDRDTRVLSWMRHPLICLAGIDGAAALAAAENILSLGAAAPDAAADAVPALLSLSLHAQSRPALDTLCGALADEGMPREIRLMAAHLLGPYLSDPGARGGALELYSLLLDSGDPKTRDTAAYCLTHSAADADPGVPPGEICAHLDKMARSDREGDRRMLETLTAFLKDHWHRMPEQALGHLERVAALPESPHLPHVMTDAVEVLNGLLRTLPGEDNRRRCLSVLDRFAAAGWSPALKLLRAMERPD